MLLGRPWIHDTVVVPSSLYQKVQFRYEGTIVTIYGDTLTIPKPIFGIDFEKEPLTLDDFEIEKLDFGRREEEMEKILMDFSPYSNNNVVAMMRKMNYLLGMNFGKTVKNATTQVPIILTATPLFGLSYKPTDDDLLQMEVRRMVCAKAKAKWLPCPPEPLMPYSPTLNKKFVKAEDSQHYWGFPKPRFDLELRTMVPEFELLFDCNNRLPEPKKEDTNWIPIDQADYMDPDAMTTLLGDAICNIEEKEYWKACQHALKSLYEARTSDEDEEGGEASSDSDEGSNNESDNSSDSNSSDNGDGEDDSNSDSESNNSGDYDSQYSGNNQDEPPSDKEDEDVRLFYKDCSDDDVDYYDKDIEDDVEAEPIDMENGIESEEYKLENVLEVVEEVVGANNKHYDDYLYRHPSDWSCIVDVSSRLGP